MSGSTPELWHLDISHFNEKVRWALDYKRIPHIRHSIFPGSQDIVARRVARAKTTPVVKIDGQGYGDSTKIIAELERRWPDPALYPEDAAERARALELEDFFDEHCAHEMRRALFDDMLRNPDLMSEALGASKHRGGAMVKRMGPVVSLAVRQKYKISPETAAEGRAVVLAAMDRLEAEIGESGYLVGERFSVADLGAAAIFSVIVQPPQFQYHQVDPHTWPEGNAKDLVLSLEGRPGWNWVLDMYAKHRGVSAEVT